MEANNQKIKLDQDLSFIDGAKDLDKEIRRVKAQIRIDEYSLKNDMKLIPREAIRSVVGNAVPFFVKTTVADKTWNIMQTVISLFIHNPLKKGSNKGTPIDNILQTAKNIGVFSAIGGIKSFFDKRKKKKQAEKAAKTKEEQVS